MDLHHARTFLASFFAFRCFAADAFSILFRNRTGTRFDFGFPIFIVESWRLL